MDIIHFVVKFGFILALSGGLVLSGIYVYVIGYGVCRNHKESRKHLGNGCYFVYTPSNDEILAKACNKFNTRKVFRWSVGLAVLIMIAY